MSNSNIRIKVTIELAECDGEKSETQKKDDGSFEMIISENDSINIDKCESALMRTAYPAIRKTLSEHFSMMSQKKLLRKPGAGKSLKTDLDTK